MSDITTAPIDRPTLLGRGGRALLALVGLVVLADVLIWPVFPGISLLLVFLAIGSAIVWLRHTRLNDRGFVISGILYIASLLPLVDALSWSGGVVALVGTSLFALGAAGQLPRRFEDVTSALTRFASLAPFRLLGDFFGVLSSVNGQGLGSRLWRIAITWIVPTAFALTFLMLFASANPLIETALNAIRLESAFGQLRLDRILFWLLVAVLTWPLLRPKVLLARPSMQGPMLPRAESLLFGRSAIVRSLILFNLLFAVQSVMDALYLWGGVRLPDGLSYADYAHRGAYPLIVTALLAGTFVLAAMRPNGPAEQSVLIRRLVYVWIGQNVVLVVSSILRLDLYVQVYSLTELRIAAGIWMGLVAVGLLLILLRIVLRRSNAWLLTMNAAALGLTLYTCAFVDFPAVIMQFNVENSRELGGKGQPLDFDYLGELGPSALPAAIYYLEHQQQRPAVQVDEFELNVSKMIEDMFWFKPDWRGWTFRHQRLRDWLETNPRFAGVVSQAMNGATSP